MKYLICTELQKDALEQGVFRNFLKLKLQVIQSDTVYNVITEHEEVLADIADEDLTSDKYPILARQGTSLNKIAFYTTIIYEMMPLTNGKYGCIYYDTFNLVVTNEDGTRTTTPTNTAPFMVGVVYEEITEIKPEFVSEAE